MRLKFAFIVIFFFFSIQGINALELNVEKTIPAGVQWSASIDYSLPAGNELNVYLDDELFFSVFNKSSTIFVDEKQKSPYVLAYNISDDKLVLSIAGMSEGDKVISAKTFSGSTQTDFVESSIVFFQAISYTERNELMQQINSLQQTISNLKQDLNTKNEQIKSLSDSEKDFIESLNKINLEISSLQQDNNIKQESLAKISSDLNELIIQREEQKNPLGGLFGFGSSNSLIIGTIFLIAIGLIGIVLYARTQKISLYKK